MSDHAVWLALSFAIMVVAVLAKLSDQLEKLERRLTRLEFVRSEPDDCFDGSPAPASPSPRRAPRNVTP